MRSILASGALAALVSGCALEIATDPDTFSLDDGRLTHLKTTTPVVLQNRYNGPNNAELKMGPHTWVIDQHQLTNTAIAILKRGMEKQGLAVAPAGERTVTLRVSVLGARVQGMAPVVQTNARVSLEAELADGTSLRFLGDNTSPWGAPRAFDGAVLFALNQLLIDPKFVA